MKPIEGAWYMFSDGERRQCKIHSSGGGNYVRFVSPRTRVKNCWYYLDDYGLLGRRFSDELDGPKLVSNDPWPSRWQRILQAFAKIGG